MSAQPTILLVEDDPATLAATKRLLERAHLRCETAATGNDGLQLARALRPHLVLLDLALPDGSGTEVLRQIRADPDLESVSVVFLTSAKTPPDTRSPGVEGGADGFISRPVSNADLLAQVQMHLGQWEQKEKLRASQARFRNLITDLPDALLVVNQAAVIQFANPAAAVLLERPTAELCGSTFGFPLAATGGTEIEVPLPGQSVRVAAMRVLPTTWDGEPAWLASLRDLTEQKRLQAALAAQADFTQRVFDSTDAHQAVVGPDGRILAVNEAWRRFARLNHAGGENTWGVGASYFRACRPETGETSLAAEAYEGVRRVQQNLLPSFELEYPCHAPKEQHWFLLRVVPLLRQPGAVLVSHTNVTARRRAEAEARRNQERFSALFQHAPLNSVLWRLIRDRQGEIVDWEVAAINKPGAASIGLTPEAAVGRRAVEMFGAEVMAPYLQFSREDVKSGQPRQHETYFATNGRHYLATNFLIGPELYANISVDITEGKQAEAALRRSEGQLRTLVNTLPDLVWLKDTQGVYLACNARFEKFFGATEAEIVGKTDYDFKDREVAEQFRAHDAAAVAAGCARMNEEEVTFAHDGHREHLETIKTPVLDTDGRLIGVLGIGRDITARKQAEAALSESNERFRLFMANSPTIAWVKDEAGRHLFVNHAFEQHFGVQLADLQGKTDTELWPPDIAAQFRQNDLAVLAGGQPVQVAEETRNPDGSRTHWLSTKFPFRDANGRRFVAGIALDITERKRQAEEIVRARDYYLNLLETAPALVWRSGTDAKCDWFNQTWLQFTGRRLEQELGDGWAEGVHPEDLDRCVKHYLACFQRREAFEMEYRLRHHSGEYRWIVDFGVPLQNLDGQFGGYIGYCYDITARKQAEAALGESEARFRTLVEQAPEGIFIQTQRRFAYVNATMVRLLGATGPEQLLGQMVESRVHPDFRSLVRERIRRLNEERLPQSPVDQVFLQLDGSPRDVTVSAVPFEFDREPGALVFVRDITERKRAQEAEQQSEARRALALKAAQAGTWEWDLATNRNTWSEELWELYGLEPHSCEPTYETWQQTLHPGDCERVEQELQRVVQQEGELSLEWRVKNAGERARWLLSRGRPLRDAAGRVVRYVGVVLDITERKRAEAEAAAREAIRLAFREAGSLESAYVKLAQLLASHLGFTVGVVALHDAARDEMLMTGGRSDGTELPRVLRVPASQTFSSIILRTGQALVETHISRRPECHHEAIHKLGLETFIGVPLRDGDRVIGALGIADRASREDAAVWLAGLQNIAHTVSLEIARQRALDSLTVSEARQRAILDNIPDPAWLKDGEGQFLAVNKPWCDFVGVTLEQAVGHRDTELFPPEVARKFREEEQQLAATGKAVQIEELLPDASGQPRWFESHKTPLFDAEGRLSAHIGIARDITERMRNEQERARLFAAIEHSGEAIVITDSQCRIQYVNGAFEQNTGYTKAEALGQNPRFLRSGQHDAAFYRSIWHGLKQDGVWRGRFTNRHKQGRLFYEDATITAVVDADGQVLTYIAVKRDVTRAVQMEEQLRQAQKLEAIGQLAGGVAHDFNNILSAVMMQAGLVQMAPGLDEDARNALLEVGRTAQRGAAFTRRLLLFSRRTTPTLQALDLNELVANLLKMLRRLVPEDVSLDFQPTPGLPTVAADGGMMDQVIMNLVLNARDAMPQGGGITLRSQLLVFEALDCAADPNRRPGAFVCLTVADTGCGMDAATLKRIFEPFFTTKEAGKGTGLGLATVHGIVAQHHGWVEVESAVGHGTTFRVYLPAKAEPTTAVSGKAADEEAPHGTGTLLLVEDEEGLRQSLTRTLQRLGYQVHVAQSGEEAMRLWPTVGAEVALVLTDMVMPGTISGWDLALTLQGLKPGLPVILSTGYTDRIDTRLGLPPGMVLLPKPYGVATLARLLRDCLHGPSALPGEAPSAAPAKPVRSLSRDWVSTLPDDLRGQFVVAAERAYHDTLQGLCDRVATLDAELGARLHELVKAFDYTALLELFLPGKK